MAKVKFTFKQKDSDYGYKETMVTHVKLMDDEGKYIKFAKQTPDLMEKLSSMEFDIPNSAIE